MDSESQDAVTAIENALGQLRRDQMRARMHGGPGGHGPERHGMGRPPWGDRSGDGKPPWGDGPGPWARGGGPGGLAGGAARLRLLDALVKADASGTRLGISEIADAIGVDQPRASRLVNDAVERGLLTRRADERDARRSVVELTDAGRAILTSMRESRRSTVTDALQGFTAEETATFAALFTRFVAGLPHR